MPLCGSGDDHCCYFRGEVCQYLRQEYPTDRYKWSCALRTELGDWDKVHNDERYIINVKPNYTLIGHPDLNCGDFPQKGVTCHTCGNIG